MKISFRFKLPKFRNPFSSPVHLTKLQQRLFGKKQKKLTWRRVGVIGLWSLGVLALIIVFLFAWFAKDLPGPNKIAKLVSGGSTKLYARGGELLYTISGDKKMIALEGKDIPDNVKQATIALEDKDFYKHSGISFKSIVRSVFVDIFTRRYSQGGSTITQQLVKNVILKDKSKRLVRKTKELILSIELEALYSKDEILTMYLNQIPYGGNNYGIEAASRSFFGKSAKELTLSEAATLAALPQAPTTLSPYGQNVDRLIGRRDLALKDMYEQGYISKAQQDEATADKPQFSAKKEAITAPHFVLYVKDWLVDFFTEELGDKQLAEQKVEEGGLSVTTTIMLDKQLAAEDIISRSKDTTLKKARATNAGLVSIDPKRGEVIAMVGSVDYNNPTFGNFNIATAKRQPGSSIKPLVYAAAFKEKYNPGYVLYDVKTDFGNYAPDNYDGQFRGPISIRKAIGNSLNIPAVKTLALIGLDKALKTAGDMGITTLTDKNRYGLSLVLGGGEVRLLDMATAYGVFANNGTLVPTTPVLKIVDTSNKEIYNHDNPKDARVVLDPQIAYEISDILSDTDAKKPIFTNVMANLSLSDRKVAVKTGTTDSYRDAWTIGYTPQYVTAVWAGNNDNSTMDRAGGSLAAAPMWKQMMVKLHEGVGKEDFSRPSGIQTVTVDKLSNKLPIQGSDPVTDIFASWQVPTEKDDIHVQVRVCKENGLLADSNISDELAELRTFNNIHSEKPNLPNWEEPVINWAKANGLYNPPPTEKCQSGNVKPSIQITSPASGSSVTGSFTISANASAGSGVKSVEFLIDNASIGIDTDSPFSTSYDSNKLSEGSHTLTAVVSSNSGSTATASISFTVTKDTTAPGNVTNYQGSKTGSGRISLSWTNPTDSDFKSVKIYVYKDQTSELVQTIEILKPSQSTTIIGLTTGVAYRFTARSVDQSGNESSGATLIFTPD